MTPRLRRISSRQLLQGLRPLGFEVVSVEGSHAKLQRTTGTRERQTLTVPLHDELAPGTLVAIYRQLRRYVSDELARPLFYR
jgi:predicted RNA binding protein YcfA (HicA-like mRNA interferase family)